MNKPLLRFLILVSGAFAVAFPAYSATPLPAAHKTEAEKKASIVSQDKARAIYYEMQKAVKIGLTKLK